jgi:hypothetical protein
MASMAHKIARRSCLAAAVSLAVAAGAVWAQTPPQPFSGKKLADGQAYVTLVQLKHQPNSADNGRVLIAFEESGIKGIPLYESRDEGSSWQPAGHATDPVRADQPGRCNMHWQPHLMELPRRVRDLPAGAIMLSASAVCNDERGRVAEQHLRLYSSTDQGRTWNYISQIIEGTVDKPVWEPNLRLLDDDRLVTYYSSEQHKAEGFNQLLAYKVSSDGGRTWGPEIPNVAMSGGVERPGMAIVDRLPDGRYVLSYELVNGPNVDHMVYVKFSKDGLDWGKPSDRGVSVRTLGGQYAASTPTITWFPAGGPKGVLVVASRNGSEGGDPAGHAFYWNRNGGEGPWWEVPAPVKKRPNSRAGWTQAVMMRRDGSFLHLTSSGSPEAPDNGGRNEILYDTARLDFDRYEAEDAARKGAALMRDPAMSNASKVRLGSGEIGLLTYRITVPTAGTYDMRLHYAQIGFDATPRLTVNGQPLRGSVSPVPRDEATLAMRNRDLGTRGTGEMLALGGTVRLKAGENLIEVRGGNYAVDVDFLQLVPAA